MTACLYIFELATMVLMSKLINQSVKTSVFFNREALGSKFKDINLMFFLMNQVWNFIIQTI